MSALTDSAQRQQRSRVPRIAEAAVERARLSVVPRRSVRAPRVPFVMLVSLLLVSGVAGLLMFNTSMQQRSFTATALEGKADVLAAREQSLRMDLEKLRDPQQVALAARQMGMVPPPNPVFLRLSDGKVLGAETPAVPADGIRVVDLPPVMPADFDPAPLIVRSKRTNSGADGAAADSAARTTDSKKQRGDGTREQGSGR